MNSIISGIVLDLEKLCWGAFVCLAFVENVRVQRAIWKLIQTVPLAAVLTSPLNIQKILQYIYAMQEKHLSHQFANSHCLSPTSISNQRKIFWVSNTSISGKNLKQRSALTCQTLQVFTFGC